MLARNDAKWAGIAFSAESAAAQSALQRRALHEEARHLLEPNRLNVKLCDGPEPGQLRKHSKRDARAKIGERGRRGILSRKIGSLIAGNRERTAFGLLERHSRSLLHSLETFRLDGDP
jgi:hypothetical protein